MNNAVTPRACADKVRALRNLHAQGFVVPNPWDEGSARVLEALGFRALATTSAGFAFTLGKPDGSVRRGIVIEHLRKVAAAVSVPVSADLENCFGDAPVVVAETITLASQAGAAGGSVEDGSGDAARPIYEFAHAVERVRAAAEAAASAQAGFVLTARAENFLHGHPDLGDTIRRLQAFQEAGADVLFAPGLTDAVQIRTVVRALDKPLNVMIGFPAMQLSVPALFELGVRRVSTGSSLARAAFGALMNAARELQGAGTTRYVEDGTPAAVLNGIFSGGGIPG